MSTSLKCDTCGEVCNEGIHSFQRQTWSTFNYVTLYGENNSLVHVDILDICPECSGQILHLLERAKNE